MIDAISFAISITIPNLLLIALGYYMQSRKQTSAKFVEQSSALVFNYCLPSFLFFHLINSHVDIKAQLPLISAGVLVTFILFFGAEIYAKFFIEDPKDKGVFVQGVFRSNMAIISLATVHNAYGSEGLGIGAVYIGVITILFNVLAVITLSRADTISSNKRLGFISRKIITNPLIISLISAFIYKSLPIPLPHTIIQKTGHLLANTALPLALICAGATLNVRTMFQLSGLSMRASIARIFFAPVVAIAVGFLFKLHLDPVTMGVLFLMVASPAASASYVMAKAMGGNDVLAANILAFTTVFAMVGMAIGSGILRAMGWM